VHWRVYRHRDGHLTIVDVGADNIWLAIEQLEQFTSVIANNGGPPAGIDALIADLKEQTADE
jgi:phospholipid transport system substrate-binding protein